MSGHWYQQDNIILQDISSLWELLTITLTFHCYNVLPLAMVTVHALVCEKDRDMAAPLDVIRFSLYGCPLGCCYSVNIWLPF